MANQVIYPENNPYPRDAFSCCQSKQGVSLYNSNYHNRFDKSCFVLNYGQIPLTKSRYLKYVTEEQHPYGENAIVVENVSAMPGQGVTSMFNFGQTFGAIKGICAALGLPIFFVRPAKWKKYFNLINSQKDASRTKAIQIFPYISSQLSKKKDANKADAILLASFFFETYQSSD